MRQYQSEGEETDFFDAVMMIFYGKVEKNRAEQILSVDLASSLFTMAFDESLFRSITRPVRKFFQQVNNELSSKNALFTTCIGLVDLYFEFCSIDHQIAPTGCWSISQSDDVDPMAKKNDLILIHRPKIDRIIRENGYSSFIWISPNDSTTEQIIYEMRLMKREKQEFSMRITMKDKEIAVSLEFTQPEKITLIKPRQPFVLSVGIIYPSGTIQISFNGKCLFSKKVINQLHQDSNSLSIHLLPTFVGKLNSYISCYEYSENFPAAITSQISIQGIQSHDDYKQFCSIIKMDGLDQIITPLFEGNHQLN